jgi:hypothetical protein
MKKKQSHKNVQRRVLNYIPPLHKKKVNKRFDRRAFSKNLLFLCVIIACVFGIWYVIFGLPKRTSSVVSDAGTVSTTTSGVISAVQSPCNFRRVLDGVCAQNQESVNAPIVAVMVENSLDAQPLSGISQASIVYEAPTEGNIPRFLTIFPLDASVEKLGPVRSARPYYLDFVSEYADAMYMHVGGSPEALQKIQSFQLFDMNEMYNAGAFWRATNRFAPHNTYTSSDLWNTVHEKNIDDFKNDQYSGWKYEEKPVCSVDCIQKVSVAFSPAYKIDWKYTVETGLFERSLNGRVQQDEDGTAYKANNVIIQHVKMSVIDEVGRKRITTVGSGTAEMFVAGVKIEGTWKKTSRSERTMWFDVSGNEVLLSPGKTWVEIVGTGMSFSAE